MAKKVKENIEKIQTDNPDAIALIDELKTSIEKLDKTIEGKDLAKLETAVKGLKDSLNNEKKCFANSTYLQVLNRFLNENNDLKGIL